MALSDRHQLIDPAARYDVRESVEIVFVAALQHLPATQRAVLILREVLAFSAAEVAGVLETTVPAVNSALQRARASVDRRVHPQTQKETVAALGDERAQELLDSLMAAWKRADVPAILELLVDDVAAGAGLLPAARRPFPARWADRAHFQRDRIAALTPFLAPMLDERFELPPDFRAGPMSPRRSATRKR